MLRLRRWYPCAALTGLVVLVCSGSARAQTEGFRLDRFHAPMSGLDGISVQTPDTVGHLGISAQLILDYADHPLAVGTASSDMSSDIVGGRLGGHLVMALGLYQRFQLGLMAPFAVAQSTSGAMFGDVQFHDADTTSFGDLQVSGLARVAGAAHHPRLGVLASLSVPTGSRADFTSDGTVGASIGATAAMPAGPLELAADVGIGYRPSRTFVDAHIGTEAHVQAGLRYAPFDALRLMAEISAATVLTDSPLSSTTSPVELLAGGRYYVGNGFFASLAGGAGLTNAVGTPEFRVLTTVGWLRGDNPDDDGDHDDIPNGVDACPRRPEDADHVRDDDGCPDEDDDGDGIPDADDECPAQPEDRDGFRDEDGCIDRDNDGDDIVDGSDRCPDQPETINQYRDIDGCPDELPDRDGDGISDELDTCPDQAEDRDGDRDQDGCPDFVSPQESAASKLPGPLVFEKGLALPANAEATLRTVIELLDSHPQIRTLVVQGHTDSSGPAEANLRMSEQRAFVVLNALVVLGADPSRLRAEGMGGTTPIAPNDTPEGRARNRRVEFHIGEWDPKAEK